MPKGYPKSRFEIVNQTQIQNIETSSVSNPTALYMQLYLVMKYIGLYIKMVAL